MEQKIEGAKELVPQGGLGGKQGGLNEEWEKGEEWTEQVVIRNVTEMEGRAVKEILKK